MRPAFHVLLIASFVYFLVLRTSFSRKAKKEQRHIDRKEGLFNMIVRAILGLGYIGMMLVYLIYPGLFEFSAILLPPWIHWFGLGLTLLSLAGLHWVQWALDIQFNTTLHVQENHKLIDHGPYHWVRHPMYTVLFLLGLGWGLLAANWLIGFPVSIALIGIVIDRVPKEERVLLDTFGEQYRDYMDHTGRFLPKFTGNAR